MVVPFQGQASAAPPSHALSVTGEGVASYPAFDPAVERYAATTTTATDGTLTITASTSDPQGRIWIDGAPDADGSATVTGLGDGDEVSVFIDDSSGRAVHTVVYLPHDFPALSTTVDEPGQQPGHVFLTPNRFAGGSDTYEAAVDHLGVPAYVRANREAASQDFKPTGRGGYQVFRDPVGGDAAGSVLLELDEQMATVRELRTVGLTHTDAHDAVLLPDGGWIIGAYEAHTAPARTDAVIQQISADGQVVREWNSADHMAPVDPADPDREAGKRATDSMNPYVTNRTTGAESMRLDYAHVNSFELVDDDQNLLVSFRNTSSLFKIAWSDAADRTDGHDFGDVVWRFGGKHSDFTFVDDPYLGPCAQHTATQLANGNILIYDNGSPDQDDPLFFDSSMCVDPADPTGEPIGRDFTRISEYALDTDTGEATLVWDYTQGTPPWFAFFAGGVTRQANGNTLISWASTRTAMVTEVEAGTDEVLWQLEDARTHGLGSVYFSYRAVKGALPDLTAPTATLTMPPSGTTFTRGQSVPVTQQCRDTGGSSLVACAPTGATAGSLDTSVTGPVTLTLTATDGAGNSTSTSRTYEVLPAPVSGPSSTPTASPAPEPTVPPTATPTPAQPDAAVRAPGGRWIGAGDHDGRQRASTPIRKGSKTFKVRVRHDGQGPADLTVRGSRGDEGFRVRYLLDGRDVTRKVRRGRLELDVDASADEVLRVRVTRTRRVEAGAVARVRVRVSLSEDPTLRDTVQARVRAPGGR